MAYKKYIKRDGKVYGPYIYHSRKVNGKVISEYRGKYEEKNNKRKQILTFLIIALVIFSLIIGLNYNKIDFNQGFKTTKSILNNIITPIIKSLTGFAVSESSGNETTNTTEQEINDTVNKTISGDSEDESINASEPVLNGNYQFDGINDYIDLGNNPNLNFGTGDFTVEAWFKLSSHPTNASYGYPIVQKTHPDYDDGWWLWVRNMTTYTPPYYYSTRIRFGVFGGGITQSDSAGTTALELDTWYHAVGIKGTNYSETYLNGVIESSSSHSSVNSDSTENLLIGTWIDFGSYFNGTIDNVKIFNRSLSADEVKALYEQRLTTQETQSIFDLKVAQGVKE